MYSLDKDRNGELARDEFIAFCMGGLSQTAAQRREYAKQSTIHNKLAVQMGIVRTVANGSHDIANVHLSGHPMAVSALSLASLVVLTREFASSQAHSHCLDRFVLRTKIHYTVLYH